jgi:putative tryptophan/tyrosine transport system substrate-binding protein
VFAFQSSQVRTGASLVVGRDYQDSGRQAAALAARIMRGERPGAIPFQPVTRTRVIVNLDAARHAGLVIPRSIVEHAAEVIGK